MLKKYPDTMHSRVMRELHNATVYNSS